MSKTPKQYSYTCPIYGKSFTAYRVLNRYCSEECRQNARREQDRNRKKELRAQRSEQRNAERKEADRKRAEQIEARNRQAKEDFENRCKEGDLSALLIREKAAGGNCSLKYWELFAKAEIQAAEDSGEVSRTIINGISVYEDDFAEHVVQSIERTGFIQTGVMKRRYKKR